jgi:chromosome segregation ATPase
MTDLVLLKQRVEQLQDWLFLEEQSLSEVQLDNFKIGLKELSDLLTIHAEATTKAEQRCQTANSTAIEERNQMHQHKIATVAAQQAQQQQLVNKEGQRDELNRQIVAQQTAIGLYQQQHTQKLREKAEIREKTSWAKYAGLIGFIAYKTGLLDKLSDVIAEIAGIEGKIRQLNEAIEYNLQEKDRNRIERSTLEQQIHASKQRIIELTATVTKLEEQLHTFAYQLQALADELVLAKQLLHGLKAALVEVQAVEGKQATARALFQAFKKSRFTNLRLKDKVIHTLQEALQVLQKALAQLPSPTATRSLHQSTFIGFHSLLLGPI